MHKSGDFARFIDELRDSRNISREDFVRNIISSRQYYRYIRGESSLKDETLNRLLDRLETTSIYAYEAYRKKQDKNYADLINIYKEIHLGNFDNAEKHFRALELSSVVSKINSKMLGYIEISLDLHFNRIDFDHAYIEILELMEYPDILKKESLSFIEISCVLFVSDTLIKNGDYRLSNYGYELLKKENQNQLSDFRDQLLPLQFTIIKSLGRIGKYDESISLAKKAINDFEIHSPLNILLSINYAKALSERERYKDNRYFETLIQIYSICRILKNQILVNEMKRLVSSVFDVKESDLIIYRKIKK